RQGRRPQPGPAGAAGTLHQPGRAGAGGHLAQAHHRRADRAPGPGRARGRLGRRAPGRGPARRAHRARARRGRHGRRAEGVGGGGRGAGPAQGSGAGGDPLAGRGLTRAMPADTRPLAIAVMGPTASGKTAFAVELARRLDGEIVSVDSALVYRGLDIGAAKPDAAERAGVPHHLIDVREPWQPYSAAEFAEDARAAVLGIAARGRLPVLAGGTGLYFQALLRGLAAMPPADPQVRAAI